MRLLLDAHLSPRRVGARLAEAGHDVLAIADVPAYAALPDEQVLELAAAQKRVLITRNAKDFDRITRRWASREQPHGGVLLVWTRETDEFGSLLTEILATVQMIGGQDAWANLVLAI